MRVKVKIASPTRGNEGRKMNDDGRSIRQSDDAFVGDKNNGLGGSQYNYLLAYIIRLSELLVFIGICCYSTYYQIHYCND